MSFLPRLLVPVFSLLAFPVALLFADTVSTSSPAPITLSPLTAPTAGEPGVTLINLIGSGYPFGSITPDLVTVDLRPAVSGAGPALSGVVTAVTTIVGITRRITFQ